MEIVQDLFNYSFSNYSHINSKIISLFTLLEVLFVEDGRELRYKLSLRLSKCLNENRAFFKNMQRMYDKRSALVHQGENKFSDEEIVDLKEIMRKSVELFLIKLDIFSDMDKILFAN